MWMLYLCYGEVGETDLGKRCIWDAGSGDVHSLVHPKTQDHHGTIRMLSFVIYSFSNNLQGTDSQYSQDSQVGVRDRQRSASRTNQIPCWGSGDSQDGVRDSDEGVSDAVPWLGRQNAGWNKEEDDCSLVLDVTHWSEMDIDVGSRGPNVEN